MTVLVAAIVAAAFGLGGSAFEAADLAKVLFCFFLAIFVVTVVLGVIAERRWRREAAWKESAKLVEGNIP